MAIILEPYNSMVWFNLHSNQNGRIQFLVTDVNCQCRLFRGPYCTAYEHLHVVYKVDINIAWLVRFLSFWNIYEHFSLDITAWIVHNVFMYDNISLFSYKLRILLPYPIDTCVALHTVTLIQIFVLMDAKDTQLSFKLFISLKYYIMKYLVN